jgi:acetyl esterase/lipase
MGFSAGGHLAGLAATDPANDDSRPDFAALIYPVVTLSGSAAHAGSRDALLGKGASEALIEAYSVDRRLAHGAPPLFLAHAEDDKAVPVENSLLMARAAAKARVSCEIVLVPEGGHGFGLGKPGSEAATWPDRLSAWLKAQGMLDGGPATAPGH